MKSIQKEFAHSFSSAGGWTVRFHFGKAVCVVGIPKGIPAEELQKFLVDAKLPYLPKNRELTLMEIAENVTPFMETDKHSSKEGLALYPYFDE